MRTFAGKRSRLLLCMAVACAIAVVSFALRFWTVKKRIVSDAQVYYVIRVNGRLSGNLPETYNRGSDISVFKGDSFLGHLPLELRWKGGIGMAPSDHGAELLHGDQALSFVHNGDSLRTGGFQVVPRHFATDFDMVMYASVRGISMSSASEGMGPCMALVKGLSGLPGGRAMVERLMERERPYRMGPSQIVLPPLGKWSAHIRRVDIIIDMEKPNGEQMWQVYDKEPGA